ncbi:MAG: isoprenylcysteine carboxylmethyltransferase family protein [Dehalococcoidales bacterium]
MSLIPAFEIGIWNAWIFMLWPWLGMLAFRLVGREVFQRASGLTSEMKTSRAYKIISYVSMITELMAVAYSILLPFKLGTIWFYAGLTVFLLGLFVLTVALVNFAATPTNEPITRGMYRYSRHPLYLASLLIYLSVGMASVSWVFLLIFIVQLVSINIAAVGEERYCLAKYGDTYREYINRTPRCIGSPKSKAKR